MKSIPVVMLAAALAGCAEKPDATLLSFLPDATIVGSEPTCSSCSIELQLVSDLAEAKDKDVIGGDLRGMVSTRDGFLITTTLPGPPLLFAADGRLQRALGAKPGGDGNEFISAGIMRMGPGDTLLVLDEITRRLVLLSPDLTPVRSIPVPPGVQDMAVVAGGDLLIVAPVSSRDSTNPFQRISLSGGSPMAAPAATLRVPRGADASFAKRVIAPARDGVHFWSAHALRYAIEKRTLDGELVQTIERDADWFRPSNSVAEVSADVPPTPYVAGIWEDARGLLWVHTITADGRWAKALGQVQTIDGSYRFAVAAKDVYRDTRIEVIDPSTGQLLATAKFDTELPTFTPGAFLSRVLTGPSGWLIAEVWSLRLLGWRGS